MDNNYITKEDFKKFKEGLKHIVMDLIERVERLENTVNQIYDISKDTKVLTEEIREEIISKVVKVPLKETKPVSSDLVKYNKENLKELFNVTTDDWTKKFIQSIMTKGYDTLTQKQFNKLLELANKANYNKPLKDV